MDREPRIVNPDAQRATAAPGAIQADKIGARIARFLSLLALLFAAFCYLSLFRYSNFCIQLAQALIWGLAIWNRRWPLYALALAFPFFGNQPGAPYGLFFVDMTIWLILAGWFWRRWRQGASPFVYTRITPWLMLGWCVASLSLLPHVGEQYRHFAYRRGWMEGLYATYQQTAFGALFPARAWLDLTMSLLFFFYLADQWRGRRLRLRLLRNLWIGLAAAMALGLLDFFNIVSLEWFRPANPEILKFGYARLQSLFWHSGWFAQWLVLLAPAALAFSLCRAPRASFLLRAVGLGFCAAAVLVTLLTYQRGGWLAFVAGCGTVLVLWLASRIRSERGRAKALAFLGVLVLAAALGVASLVFLAVSADTFLGRRLRDTGRLADRALIWRSALALTARHPVVGVGLGRYFSAHVAEFPKGHRFADVEKGEAHNTYLHVLAERGPAGLVLLLATLLAALRCLLGRWRRCSPGASRERWLVACVGMLAAWTVYAFVQYMAYIRIVDLTFWIVLAFGLTEAGCVAASKFPALDHLVRKTEKERRRTLGSVLRDILLGLPGVSASAAGDAANRPRGCESPNCAMTLGISLRGAWWLAGPLIVVTLLSVLFRPIFAPLVENLPVSRRLGLGVFTYPYFVAVGYIPWALAVGAISVALRAPRLGLSDLAFVQIVRAEIMGAWFLFFSGCLVFFLDARSAIGARAFLALLFVVFLILNWSLLTARIARALAPPGRTSPVPAQLLAALLLLLLFCATPVLYPFSALPPWARLPMSANPLLPPVRIAQRLLFDHSMPSWRVWSALIAWSVLLAALAAALAPKKTKMEQEKVLPETGAKTS